MPTLSLFLTLTSSVAQTLTFFFSTSLTISLSFFLTLLVSPTFHRCHFLPHPLLSLSHYRFHTLSSFLCHSRYRSRLLSSSCSYFVCPVFFSSHHIPSSFPVPFALHCLSRDLGVSSAPCFVCGHRFHSICDANTKYEPNNVLSLPHRESRHMACARICWDPEFASRSQNDRILVFEQEESASKTLKKPPPFLASLASAQNLPPAPVDTAMNVLEDSFSSSSVIFLSVFNTFHFAKTEYTADVFN